MKFEGLIWIRHDSTYCLNSFGGLEIGIYLTIDLFNTSEMGGTSAVYQIACIYMTEMNRVKE